MLKTKNRRKIVTAAFLIICIVSTIIVGNWTNNYTSTNRYCISCHVHNSADSGYFKSPHFKSKDSVKARCVDCHLPASTDYKRLLYKIKMGAKDIWSYHFKELDKIDWNKKSKLSEARKHTFVKSCMGCHPKLFEEGQSKRADEAHLYYKYNKEKISCLNCHINVGHHSKRIFKKFKSNTEKKKTTIYKKSTKLGGFKSFEEKIPGTSVSFNMVAVSGDFFTIGSHTANEYSKQDEIPAKIVYIDSLFIGQTEVSWDEYIAFMSETESEGRSESSKNIDEISGATPPWGDPSQGWGMGKRPAITMTHYAAKMYCKWLSYKTGKTYRLPTEAEWEYACRAGSSEEYFFYDTIQKKRELISLLNRYAKYSGNSEKTYSPYIVKPNAFGLYNMIGNVKEFCSDKYSSSYYTKLKDNTKYIKNTLYGDEYVIRGGSFLSSAEELRSSARDYTHTKEWLMSDPQIPKSIWWYSDCIDVGFRVVCEYQ